MDVSENIEIIPPYKTASEFIEALRITGGNWLQESDWTSTWVFRGHREEEWLLIPRLWRKPSETDTEPQQMLERFGTRYGNNLMAMFNQFFGGRKNSDTGELVFERRPYVQSDMEDSAIYNTLFQCWLYTAAEVDAIREFIEMSNDLGYRIPDQSDFRPWNEVFLRHFRIFEKSLNFPGEVHHLPLWDGRNHIAVAMAQHHSVPTALLDWTRRPLFAAFFAAEDVDPFNASGNLAVWALRSDILQTYDVDSPRVRVQKIEVPKSELAFLRAQDSLFTYDTGGDEHYMKYGEWPDLRSALHGLSDNKQVVLRKLSLPQSEAGELLRLLWAEGVSRAHLMPTFDNVTLSLQSRWRWMRQM